MESASRTYQYTFDFPDGRKTSFVVSLDSISQCANSCPLPPPPWARLEHHQCEVCPLLQDDYLFCPVAVSISTLIAEFSSTVSYSACKVSCVAPERTIVKETTVQDGLASILGLLMATSGCPIMEPLRPLARFHLPFSTVDESLFRFLAAYMIRQYYLHTKRDKGDFDLKNIKEGYSLVRQVNKGMLKRIMDISKRDADKNAIVNLNSVAQILEFEADDNFETLSYLFSSDSYKG